MITPLRSPRVARRLPSRAGGTSATPAQAHDLAAAEVVDLLREHGDEGEAGHDGVGEAVLDPQPPVLALVLRHGHGHTRDVVGSVLLQGLALHGDGQARAVEHDAGLRLLEAEQALLLVVGRE
eukprot:159894-Rhodomonas_salina.2